jgi:hypothetical protein
MNFRSNATKRVLATAIALGFSSTGVMAATPHYIFSQGMPTLKVLPQSTADGATSSGSQSATPAPAPAPAPVPAAAPVADLSTTSLAFGAVPIGISSSLSVRFSNSGNAPLTLSAAPQLVGGGVFSVSAPGGTNCGSALGPGEYCDTTVVFTPVDTASAVGSLSFASNAPGSPSVVSLSGRGLPVLGSLAAAAGSSADFGGVAVGANGSNSFVFTNSGSVSLTGVQASLAGSADLSFTANTCGSAAAPATLTPGAVCSMSVRFQPSASGPLSGTLSVASSATNGTQTQALTGSGLPVLGNLTVASGSSANFGALAVGANATNSFVFTNSGSIALSGVQASLSGSQDILFTANTCGTAAAPVTLAPSATCSMTVRYQPSAGGTLAGALAVASSATNGTQSQALTGSGVGDPYWSTTNLMLAPFDTGYTDVASGRGGVGNAGNAGSISLTSAAGTSKAGSALALVNSTGATGSADANGNGVTMAASTAGNDLFAMGTGNFTIEGWYKWTSFRASKNTKCPGSIYIWTLAGSCNISWPVMAMNLGDTTATTTTMSVALSSSTMPSSGPDIANWAAVGSVSLNTWYHIALVRNGTVFTVYVNGAPTWSKTVAAGTAMGSVADTARFPGAGFGIGAGYRGQNYAGTNIMSGDGMTGYIDDFRITKGVARYTTTFTPTAPDPRGK